MNINTETKLFGSFSIKAGNNGNIFFNEKFKEYNINAIYKSFSVIDIEQAINAAKCLGFSGFAISMPFKKTILPYVDIVSDTVNAIGACNTILIENNKLFAYNTDYIAMKEIISDYKNVIILGDGGMACATKYACISLNIKYDNITRKNWNDIKDIRNNVIINCTPVVNIDLDLDESNIFINTIPDTIDGKKIHHIQACEQFKLYTGIKI